MRNANPGTRKIFAILYVGLGLLIAALGLSFRKGNATSRHATPTEQAAPRANPDAGSSAPHRTTAGERNG